MSRFASCSPPRSLARRERGYELSPVQLQHFADNGYVAGIPVLDDEQVDALRTSWPRSWIPSTRAISSSTSFTRTNRPIRPACCSTPWGRGASPGFHDLLWNPAFTVPAAQLLEGAVRFWHDQLFCKPARHGGVVAWHQDYSYWTRTSPMAHLTCWIGLDDADRDNGCLQYIPGSHKWDLLPITGLAGGMDAIREVLSPEQVEQFQPVAVELKKGECAFHHPLMIHGSYENRTDRPRRAVVVNAFRDGVCSGSDEPLLAGVPPVPKGEPMGGQFFPLLYDPEASASA